jgi:hypothetical protein
MNGDEQHILQKHLAQFLIQEVFNTVSEKDLLKITKFDNPTKSDIWHYQGNELPTANIQMLQTQARSLKESELWKILRNELRWHAEQRGLVKSKTESDLIASKMMLYIIDVIDSKLDAMTS